MGFDGLYGQDAYEYARFSTELKFSILNGQQPGSFFWPIIYPATCTFLDLIIHNISFSTQFVSMLAWVGTLWGFFKLVHFQYPQTKLWVILLYAISFIGFSPYFFRLGFTGMSDALCAFFVFQTFRFTLDHRKKTAVIWVLLFSALAVLTRYGASVLVALPIILTCFNALKQKNYLFLLVGFLVSLIISWVALSITLFEPHQVLSKSVTSDWSIAHWFQRSFVSKEGSFTYDLPNLFYALSAFVSPAYFVLGSLCIVAMMYFKIPIQKMLLGATLLYLLFIAGIHFQNKRFLVLAIPLVALLLFPGYIRLLDLFKSNFTRRSILLVLLLLNIGLSCYSFRIIYRIQQIDLYLFEAVSKYEIPTLYTFEVDVSLKGRGLQAHMKNLWIEKTIHPNSGDYVLLNVNKWKDQWKDHQLMKNVNALINSDSLVLVENLGEGWQLFNYP